MSKLKVLCKAIVNRLTMNEQISAVIKYHAVKRWPKIQRNEACPCGSGEKYKLCCQAAKRNPWKRARRNK
jgi:uncharacterized protein YchJ